MHIKLKSVASAVLAGVLLCGCGSGSVDAAAKIAPPASEAAFTAGDSSAVSIELMPLSTVASAGVPESCEHSITLSDSGISSDCASVVITSDSVTICEGGDYLVSGSLSRGQIIVNTEDEKVRLVLNGVSISAEGRPAIYADEADKLVVQTCEGSVNCISVSGDIDDEKVDAAVYASCDLTLKGSGTFAVSTDTVHAVVSRDELKVNGGTVIVSSAGKGLFGNDGLEIKDGIISIESVDDSIHSDASLSISGGTLALASGDDAISAAEALTISDGSIAISQSCEGIEGGDIVISGGAVSAVSSDDGINALSSIIISGGSVYINAGGDGIDSNGSLLVSGGSTFIDGPVDSFNGALDYTTSGSITGGTFIAAGASGMAMNFDSSSTQGTILYSAQTSQSAGTPVSLKDSDGAVLAEFTPAKTWQSVVISGPAIVEGGQYTLCIGDESVEISMTSLVYGTGFMGFGGHRGGFPGDGAFPGGDGSRPEGFGGRGGFGGADGSEPPAGRDGAPGGFGGQGGPGGSKGQDGHPGGFDGQGRPDSSPPAAPAST